MKYIIIENNIVKQVQCDNKYKLSKTETMVETEKEVVCGQIYNEETGEFTNPVIVKTKEELTEEIDNKTKKTIFAKYSDNKQRTLLMKAMSGDTAEFEVMTKFVVGTLASGQAEKDKL